MASLHVKTPSILSPLLYLAIGLFTYMIFYAPTPFDWTNPWVYIVTLLWPFVWVYEFLFWALIIIGVVFIGIFVWIMIFDR